MPKIFKLFFWTAGSFLGVVALALLVGLVLPREHKVTRRLHLKAEPQRVWALVTDHAKDPVWRSNLKSTDRLSDKGERAVWQDTFVNGQLMAYEDEVVLDGVRLTRTIVNQKHFGGTWTYLIQSEGKGTVLTLTEEGWVDVPFRAVARFVFGHASVLELYLKDVARAFQEGAKPEPA